MCYISGRDERMHSMKYVGTLLPKIYAALYIHLLLGMSRQTNLFLEIAAAANSTVALQ